MECMWNTAKAKLMFRFRRDRFLPSDAGGLPNNYVSTKPECEPTFMKD